MLVIKSIREWLEGNSLMTKNKSTNDIRILRIAMRVDASDTQQVGLVRALLSRLDIIWAELKPGDLKDIMGDLKIKQLFNRLQVTKQTAVIDNKPTSAPLVIDNPKVTQAISQTVVVYKGNNGNYYHQAKDWELCQCKHTKLKHAANPGRPFCMEKQCNCQYYFRQINTDIPVTYTKVTEQKMPMMLSALSSEALGEPASEPTTETLINPLDKTQVSD